MKDWSEMGGAAFPVNRDDDEAGMTLRDYFAAQAASGILAGYWSNPDLGGVSGKTIAREAYSVADAMLETRRDSE